MASQLRRVAMLTLALALVLLVSVGLFQTAMSAGRFKSSLTMTTKRTRGREMVAVNHYRESKHQAAATHSYLHEEAPHKDSGYHGLGIVDQTESENGGSRVLLLREREIGSKVFYAKREIPGGPDAQHHLRKRK